MTLPERDEPGLHCELVWPDPLSIVCAPEHPLARALANGRPPLVTDLGRYPAVLPARGTVTRNILLRALAPFELGIDTSLETNYLETIKMMVSVGLGWSTLPASMVDDTIVALPLQALSMQRRLGSVYLKRRTLSRAATALLALLPTGSRVTTPEQPP